MVILHFRKSTLATMEKVNGEKQVRRQKDNLGEYDNT